MPLELSYYNRKYTVSPIQLGDRSIALNIDGRTVSINPDEASYARVGQVLSGTTSENPTDPELVAMFLPQAENLFMPSKIRFEGDPSIQQKIADAVRISIDEQRLWDQLLAHYKAS